MPNQPTIKLRAPIVVIAGGRIRRAPLAPLALAVAPIALGSCIQKSVGRRSGHFAANARPEFLRASAIARPAARRMFEDSSGVWGGGSPADSGRPGPESL